jgi:hypothetical protein
VSASGNQVIVGRANGKTWTPLRIVEHPIPADKSTKLSVTARRHRIDVWLNDQIKPILAITDDHWTRGHVGVRVYTTDNDRAAAAFDNVRVTPLAPLRGAEE